MKTVAVSLLLVLLVLAPTYKAKPQNVNISESGNVRITTINGVIKCDEMICPSSSAGCSVSTTTTKDLVNVETVRKCYDSQGTTTKEEKSTAPNPYPGTEVSSHLDSSSAGVMQTFNYGNTDNVNADVASKINSINKQLQEWQVNFQQQMNTFNQNLQQQILSNFQN